MVKCCCIRQERVISTDEILRGCIIAKKQSPCTLWFIVKAITDPHMEMTLCIVASVLVITSSQSQHTMTYIIIHCLIDVNHSRHTCMHVAIDKDYYQTSLS